VILPEVSSDATLTGAINASTMRIATSMLQDKGGGLQPISYSARKLNPYERGNIYCAYDLDALAVCEVVNHMRCYLEGYSKFLVLIDHDALRHLLIQTNNMLNKLQARYPRDLQPFVGTMTLVWRLAFSANRMHESVLFCSILSLLEDNVMVQMGEDEEMSYCLYFSNIFVCK
jgi:hypothetical protein